MNVHVRNASRVIAMLSQQGRRANAGPATDGWASISVAGLD
jgi:hypothetical protein